jgi:hypothetical protein
MLTGLAVVAAVLVWQWRQRRGPSMLLSLAAGAIASAGAATGVGALLVRLRYGEFDLDAVAADHKLHYVTQAPAVLFGHGPLQVIAMLVVPAGVAAITYGIMAAGSAYDDLGVHTPAPPPNIDLILDEV